jgi:SpoVK/Ycf46/Vps4 family AAA+-type ATPase
MKPEKNDTNNDLDLKYLNAILHRITKINNVPSLSVCKDIITPTIVGESFEIKDGIYCKIKSCRIDALNNLEHFKAELYSSVYNSSQIISYIKTLVIEQENDKTNDIMSELYVFTVEENNEPRYNPRDINNLYEEATSKNKEKEEEKNKELSRLKSEIASARPELQFKTNVFVSNRRQENVKGEVASSIFSKLNFFVNNKKWYSEKGIPYHFTCMMTGQPGLGKTSCVKAVANITKRHLFIVNCGQIKTSKQFNNLFTKESVKIKTETGDTIVKIPIENRIYVLEELDILGEMLWDRRVSKYKNIDGGLSLDDFLNVFDGNIESPGRLIFLTSNYPEKLDKALTRGGRVDIMAKFIPLSNKDIIEYIKFFYDKEPSEELAKSIINRREDWDITYADICQILFSEPEDLLKSLLDKNKEKQEDFLKIKDAEKIKESSYIEQQIIDNLTCRNEIYTKPIVSNVPLTDDQTLQKFPSSDENLNIKNVYLPQKFKPDEKLYSIPVESVSWKPNNS